MAMPLSGNGRYHLRDAILPRRKYRIFGVMAAGEGADCSQELPVSPDIQSLDRGVFRCLLCVLTVPNRASLLDHLNGRRHKRLCEERDRRQHQQERSVFVSGFPRGTSEDQLKDVFQGISLVKSIVMDKDRGLYAIVEFESKDGVRAALAETQIKLDGQRLRIKPREKKEFQKKKGGTPRNLQPPDPETLSKELIKCTDVEDQMKSVVSLCSPSLHESRLRELLLNLLQETFTEFFPGCQLLPFGSSVNGFEISGCDLDLYLEMGENDGEDDKKRKADLNEEMIGEEEEIRKQNEDDEDGESEQGRKEEQIIVEESEDEEEDVTPGLSLKGLTHEDILEVVGKVLRQCVPGVHGVQSVPSARRPVIRFQHKTSGLRGDITLNNRLALRNSSFLRFCSDLDPRVPQLVYTVRYWARTNQLAGNPLGGGPLLNNYALTLLVLFFLQTRNPPVIPTLSQLREDFENEAPHVIDGWDCSFPSDPTQVRTSDNLQSLSNLLSEFFSYYSSLDLPLLILCPSDGSTLLLPFSSTIPPWSEGFRLGPLNIQDPFELSHNVCGNVSSRTARRFITNCTAAARICRSPLYHLPSPNRPWGITLVLLPTNAEGEKSGKGSAEVLLPLAGASLEEMCAVVKRVLVEVLLCTCEEEEEEEETIELSKKEGATCRGRQDEAEANTEEGEQEVPCKEGQNNREEAAADTKWRCESEDGMRSETEGKKRERTETSERESRRKRKRRKKGEEECARDTCANHQTSSAIEGLDMETDKDNGCHQWEVLVWHMVWEGRRKERRRMRGGKAQGSELEAAVSRALVLGKGEKKCDEPLITVTVKAKVTGETHAQIYLIPKTDLHGLSPTFFHFLEGFLPRMVGEMLSCN
ncbi:speckle targeted PIP5K1A-regulated poly(A) polymerase [Rhinophrynus dorsalis]